MWNIALCGTGMISEGFVQSTKAVEGLKILAVHSRHEETAKAFASKYQINKTYTDYATMLKDPEIQLIYIGLPNSLHYGVALEALKAKKHVIVEKPFVSNMPEYIHLIQTALENEVKVFEMNRVLELPNYTVIKDHLKDIAPIRTITINFCKYSRKYNDYLAGKNPNVFSSEFSGGALADLGVYGVHFVTGLFGMPSEVDYVAQQLPNTIDASGNLTLKYDGFIASLVQSKNSKADPLITVQGEKGSMFVRSVPGLLPHVELDMDKKSEIGTTQPYDGVHYIMAEALRILDTKDENAYRAQLDHIQTVMTVLDEARKTAGIVFTADKLMKKQHWFSFKPKAPKAVKEKAAKPAKAVKAKKEKTVKAKKEKPVKAKKEKASK